MTDPKRLTAEEFFPFAVYGARLADARERGLGILLPPAPDCPACGQRITEIAVRDDYQFTEDIVWLGAKPCGHQFTIPGDAAYEAANAATAAVGDAL
jgi:hypothetical protein